MELRHRSFPTGWTIFLGCLICISLGLFYKLNYDTSAVALTNKSLQVFWQNTLPEMRRARKEFQADEIYRKVYRQNRIVRESLLQNISRAQKSIVTSVKNILQTLGEIKAQFAIHSNPSDGKYSEKLNLKTTEEYANDDTRN